MQVWNAARGAASRNAPLLVDASHKQGSPIGVGDAAVDPLTRDLSERHFNSTPVLLPPELFKVCLFHNPPMILSLVIVSRATKIHVHGTGPFVISFSFIW